MFAELPWECQPSVSAPRVVSHLHSMCHLLFSCLTHYEIPLHARATEISASFSLGIEIVDDQEVRAAGNFSLHPTCLMSRVSLGDCEAHISSCWSLVAAAGFCLGW